ncbi:MAG: serine/threonine-protein phosphatase [Betaproteobacteria bacterium]|nr:serine/threonine-protein phosphatase [Betaproteobacteria bacterium]
MELLPPTVAESLRTLLYQQRALAYILVDNALDLVRAGGFLERYGLTGLRLQQPASSQIDFLEGMLPLAETPFLIRSMEMPSGRIADVHFFAHDEGVWILFLDVTTEHHEAQLVQQKAYDMTLLSEREARLIEELEAANRALAKSQEDLLRTHRRLDRELEDAANYVQSILPARFSKPFVADWRFVPSSELGGDSFGYHWVDDDHFALFLLDVCGHGVGAAMVSIVVANMLRSEGLADTDFRAPAEVLTALNRVYQMEQHNDLYFSIWYGVYRHSDRCLKYAAAGHHPTVLVSGAPAQRGRIETLAARGPSLGIAPGAVYRGEERVLPAQCRLFLFSDGTFEIGAPDGSMLEFDRFLDVLAAPVADGESELDRLLEFVRNVHGPGPLEDDFSIIRLAFRA